MLETERGWGANFVEAKGASAGYLDIDQLKHFGLDLLW